MMPAPYEMSLCPRAEDMDEMGHVNNVVYVRWLQEIAIAHWEMVAKPEWIATYFWVVSRHEVDYLKSSVAGENLLVKTWGDNPRGARFDRRIDIYGPAGDLRIRASTTWVLMDRELVCPARVPRAILDLFLLEDSDALA